MDPVSLGLVGASVAGGLLSKSKKNKVPWEVADAWNKLRNFGMTGKIGDYTAGMAYGGDLGNYDKSTAESQGQNLLMSLLQSGRPEMFDAATGEIKNLLTTDTYDPYNEKGLFKGFADSVDRSTRESTDALKRAAAFGGNLFSKDTAVRLGNLQEQGLQQKSNKLAELYDTFAQRRLSAVPLALQAGQAQESINQNRIGSAFQYGGLDRSLADAKAKAGYADFLRKQGEKQAQIGALQSVAGGYPGQTYSPSPYESVLQMLATVGGYGLMNKGGGGSGMMTPEYKSTYLPPSLSLNGGYPWLR